MSPALGPRANYNGDGTYQSFTNSPDSIPNVYNDWEIEQVRPRHVPRQYNWGTGDNFHHTNNVSNDCVMVHFTNWLYYHKYTGNFVYIVYIDNLVNQCNKGKFYYFQVDYRQNVTIFHFHNVPEGLLTIVHSSWWVIAKNIVNMCCRVTELSSSTEVNLQVVFESHQKDCVVQQYLHMPYERYMECIIDAPIDYQDKVIDNTVWNNDNDMSNRDNNNDVRTSSNMVLTASNNTSVDCSLPIDLKAILDNNTDHGVTGRDFFFPKKNHGHLTLKTEHFHWT